MQEVFERIIERLEELQSRYIELTLGHRMTEDVRRYIAMNAAVDVSIEIVKQEAAKNNNGWIPCSERLPNDCDNRFYMCILENHEEDLPMLCQYEEDYGFGFWQDIYDEHSFEKHLITMKDL